MFVALYFRTVWCKKADHLSLWWWCTPIIPEKWTHHNFKLPNWHLCLCENLSQGSGTGSAASSTHLISSCCYSTINKSPEAEIGFILPTNCEWSSLNIENLSFFILYVHLTVYLDDVLLYSFNILKLEKSDLFVCVCESLFAYLNSISLCIALAVL